MARLGDIPNRDIVSKFKGSIDFYVWGGRSGHGIPVARKWPSRRLSPPSQAELDSQQVLRYAMNHLGTMPAVLRQGLSEMAGGTSLGARDIWIRCYVNGATL